MASQLLKAWSSALCPVCSLMGEEEAVKADPDADVMYQVEVGEKKTRF